MKEKDQHLSTAVLLDLLFKEKQLDAFFRDHGGSFHMLAFSDYITALCEERNQIAERIIERADIEKSYGHKIFAGTRKPSRDMVIRLAFGFGADLELAQKLLSVAGKSSLYPRVKRDTVIIYCLHNRLSVVEAQILLNDLHLPLLGEENKNERA